MKRAQLNRLRRGSLIAITTLLAACSSDSSNSSSTSDGGSGGNTTQASTTQASTTQASTTQTSTAQATATASGTDSGGSDSGTANASNSGGGSGGDSGFADLGVCGVRSEGTVTEDSFESYEEHYLLGDEGLGEEVCVVRFDVRRVGDGPEGCDEFAGQQQSCLWTHLVELSNPQTLVDEDSACENSELAMTAEAIAELDGEQRAYGYVFEYQGHNSVLMGYDEDTEIWGPIVNAGWNDETGDFQFDRRDGFCGY